MTLSKVAAENQRMRMASARLIRAWQKLPTPDGIAPPINGDMDRFLSKIERAPSRVAGLQGPCWEWRGTRLPAGYGQFGGLYNGSHRMLGAHRVAYSWFMGPIPAGLEIDHLCANPPCVSPWHLEPVTQAENVRRAAARITHCVHGHEFTLENTYRNPKTGRRECRSCNARRSRELRERRAA